MASLQAYLVAASESRPVHGAGIAHRFICYRQLFRGRSYLRLHGADYLRGGERRIVAVLGRLQNRPDGGALGAVAEETPALQLTDYERLEKRAEDQRNRVEVERLVAAKGP